MNTSILTGAVEDGVFSVFWNTQENIFTDRAREDGCFLSDEGDCAAVRGKIDVVDVLAVVEDFAGLNFVEPSQKCKQLILSLRQL
jgi:hypothetical protein